MISPISTFNAEQILERTVYVKAQKDNREFVISLADGRIVYQESNVFPDYDYIQYLLKDCMIIQTRDTVATAEKGGWPIYQYSTAMYDYEGNIISDKYSYISPQMGLYNMALSEGKEAEMLFSATTMDGTDLIINADEEVLFTLEARVKLSLLTAVTRKRAGEF